MHTHRIAAAASLAVLLAPPLLYTQQPAVLRLERTITADQLNMGYVGAITADARGRIYALETSPDSRSVVVLDSTGKIVARFGRPGQGPGEFQSPRHTLGWTGDTLLVVDSRAVRITGFDRDGRAALIREGGTQLPSRLLSARGHTFGALRGLVSTGGTQLVRAGQILERSVTLSMMRISRDGSGVMLRGIADTIPGLVAMQCAQPRGDDLPFVELPFRNPLPLVAVTPAGEIVKAHLDKYQVDVIDAESGRIMRSIRRDAPTRPLTSADLARTVEGALLLDFERSAGGKLVADLARNRPCPVYEMLPKVGPPLRSVTTDDSGRIWVEAMHATQPGQLALHVYDANGRLAAETMMPERDMRIAPYVRGDRLHIVRVDSLGVQSIALYRLAAR